MNMDHAASAHEAPNIPVLTVRLLNAGRRSKRAAPNSIPADAPRSAYAVRGHWGIENRLHWRLDVVFGEDVSRIRKGHAPTIMTSLRHLCMNLFEQEPSSLSLAKKRRKAACTDDYRAKIVFG